MDYKEAIRYISTYTNYEVVPRLPHNTVNYDLRRVTGLLSRLGNPHLAAKSIHITGSNGKGSTAAMIASALSASGYTTALYISPHLHTWRERIQVSNRMISEDEFVSGLEKMRPEIESINREARYGRLTTFEILTVLGFDHFAAKKADFQVLEVGMGGRFDATSVITPEVSIITPISLEHTDVLGKTLAEITGEKAAIIKPGGTCVTCNQPAEVNRVIEQTCERSGSRLVRVGTDVTWQSIGFNSGGQLLRVQGKLDSYELFIPLLGEHQLINAAMAVACLEILAGKGYAIAQESVADGLRQVKWPGRVQVLSQQPLIIVDGAHNPGAARRLREALPRYLNFERSTLIIGISSDKDIPGIASELGPAFNRIIVTRANHPRAAETGRISAEFRKHSPDVRVTESVAEAIALARTGVKDHDLICIAGSLFLVAEAIQNETAIENIDSI